MYPSWANIISPIRLGLLNENLRARHGILPYESGRSTEHQNNTGNSHCFWLPIRTKWRDSEDAIQFCCRRNPAATDLKFPPCWLASKGLGGAM